MPLMGVSNILLRQADTKPFVYAALDAAGVFDGDRGPCRRSYSTARLCETSAAELWGDVLEPSSICISVIVWTALALRRRIGRGGGAPPGR
mgnify:CR=1 FL=1